LIDLHAHVLPGLDDGPAEIEGSLELLRAAAADGTRTIVATPHLRHDFPSVDVHELRERCEDLRAHIPADLEIELQSAAEVDIVWAQAASDEELRLASFGQQGTDLLVETPYGVLSDGFEGMLSPLIVQGYRIVLAHPELNVSLQRDPARLARLVDQGALVQLTGASLLRTDRRSRSRRLARVLISRGLAHVIASDTHSAGPFRPPGLSDAVEAAARLDPARASWMVGVAPAAILAGKPIPGAPPVRRPGLLRRLTRR
jgi:protein-tyrosine phosphatase